MTPDDHAHEMTLARVRLLYAGAANALTGALLNQVAMVIVLWQAVDTRLLVAWTAAMLAINVTRAMMVRRFHRCEVNADSAALWDRRFLVAALVGAAAWGAAGVVLYAPGSVAHQVFLALIVAGTATGATAMYAASRRTLLWFSIIAITPLIVRFALDADKVHITMSALSLLFALLIIRTGRHFSRSITESLLLRFENVRVRADAASGVSRTSDSAIVAILITLPLFQFLRRYFNNTIFRDRSVVPDCIR